MKEVKRVGLNRVLKEIKEGNSPAQISKKYNIPKQNISYFVCKLKKKGCIQKKGYGVWEYLRPIKEVKDLTTTHSTKLIKKSLTSKKEIRGHAYIWKIQFVKPYDWNRAIRKYQKTKLSFQLMKHNKIQRTIFQSRKIWLGRKGMTIYEPMDFMGKSSFQVKGKAVFEMDLLIKNLLNELGLKFRPYRFTTSREHYAIIKNELARQYNDKKKKMNIHAEDGSIWMWIDDSKGLAELENADPTINRQVQNFWNSHKKHKFKIDADYVNENFKESARQIKKNAEHLEYHAENMRSHVAVVKQLGDAVKVLSEKIEEFNPTHKK